MKGVLPTSERVYQAVKAELLAAGFAPGERIEAVQLAERHMASITPVRAALHRLVGEGLVDARAGEGFHATLVTEASLRDLYVWNAHIIQLACQLPVQGAQHRQAAALPVAADQSPLQDIPAATALAFAGVGARSGNEHCAAAIGQLNDRLHLARLLEGELLDDVAAELDRLANHLNHGQPGEIRHAITTYHRRRVRISAELVGLMHRLHR